MHGIYCVPWPWKRALIVLPGFTYENLIYNFLGIYD
jgi:hypothetical protein